MEEKVKAFLELATQKKASDIFIIAGRPLSVKIDGKLCMLDGFEERLMPPETDEFIRIIYKLAHDRNIEPMLETGDDDFSMAIPGLSRFRVNTYRQRGSLAAVIRIIAFNLPDPQDLHIPPAVMEAADLTKGMVLITGPAGSGKSTTMACIIDKINHSREGHIITLEDPLEYLHRHDKCIVSQREICTDTANYLVSLRATLRQSPDVILLGEMRDHETIQTAMTAAETGHLILSSLHTTGAANTIIRSQTLCRNLNGNPLGFLRPKQICFCIGNKAVCLFFQISARQGCIYLNYFFSGHIPYIFYRYRNRSFLPSTFPTHFSLWFYGIPVSANIIFVIIAID